MRVLLINPAIRPESPKTILNVGLAYVASALDRAGAAAPGIRSSVGDAQTNTVAKGRVTRDIVAAPEGDGQFAQAVIPQG